MWPSCWKYGPKGQDCLSALWGDQVLDIFGSPAGRCVQFVFTGHRHSGGFHTDEHGIHHCSFESPLHASENELGVFARAEIDAENIRITGYAPKPNDFQMPENSFGRVLESDDPMVLQTRVLPLRSSEKKLMH